MTQERTQPVAQMETVDTPALKGEGGASQQVVDYAVVNKDLNAEARGFRQRIAMRWDPGDLTEYIRCWSEDDVIDLPDAAGVAPAIGGRPCKALVVILKTRGCTWALAGGCTMCGYANESAWAKVTEDELVAQFQRAWRKYQGEELVKIYTSGSFLDRFEVMPEAQKRILSIIGKPDPASGRKAPRKVAFESLPGFVTDETLAPLAGLCERLEVGIGVESANLRVLRDSVNKGHAFEEFPRAAEACRRHGVSVKAYLMCKPPFLKESDALTDATRTIVAAAAVNPTMVSLNPTNVQGNTVVDALYKRGSYRPPWLWTLVQALLDGRTQAEAAGFAGMLKSDVVAAGQDRGAHNCGKCDETVVGYLKKYKATQDRKWLQRCLDEVECSCRDEWRLTLELGPLIPAYASL
jgi:archaeosine synthase beta-subunit